MHWFWEDPDKKERGYCSVAISRTQNMMWARDLEEQDNQEIPGPRPQAQRTTRGRPTLRTVPGAEPPKSDRSDAGR